MGGTGGHSLPRAAVAATTCITVAFFSLTLPTPTDAHVNAICISTIDSSEDNQSVLSPHSPKPPPRCQGGRLGENWEGLAFASVARASAICWLKF